MFMYGVIVFLFGVAAGSYINSLIAGIKNGELKDYFHARCTGCGTKLKLHESVAVLRYLFLSRKNRCCGAAIPIRDITVELTTALIYLSVYLKFGISADAFASMCLMSVLTAAAFIDLEMRIIPNGLVISGMLLGIPFVVLNTQIGLGMYGDRLWWNPLAGILAGSGFLALTAVLGAFIYRNSDAMGLGDVKIFAPIGLFLGWRITIVALVLTIAVSGVVSLLLVSFRIMGRKETIPFAPFIAAGTYGAVMFGWNIINWYLRPV